MLDLYQASLIICDIAQSQDFPTCDAKIHFWRGKHSKDRRLLERMEMRLSIDYIFEIGFRMHFIYVYKTFTNILIDNNNLVLIHLQFSYPSLTGPLCPPLTLTKTITPTSPVTLVINPGHKETLEVNAHPAL